MTRCTAHTKTRCTAHTKGGRPCAAWAIKGGRVCVRHGAAAGQVKAAAERRLVALEREREAQRALRKFGLLDGEQPPDDFDPRSELLTELWRSSRVVSQLEAAGPTPADRGLWQAWHQQREHLRQVAESCHRAGVDEHRLAIEAAHAQLLAGLIRAVFGDPRLGLPVEQRQMAETIAAEHLRLLEAGEDVNGGA